MTTTAAADLGGAVERPAVPAPTATGIVAPAWRHTLPLALAGVDLVAAVVAVLLAMRLRFGAEVPDLRVGAGAVPYLPALLVVGLAWPGVLAALGAYRSSVVGTGPDEMGRVVEAGISLFAVVATVHLLLGTNLSGRLVAILVLVLVVLTLGVRLVADGVVQRARREHRWGHRALLYGSPDATADLARQFAAPVLGVDVVGSCHGHDGRADGSEAGDAVLAAMSASGADMLAVAGGTPPAEVRALAWALEGTGAELMIAPAVPDLAQQRVVVETVGGAVLLRVEECRQQRSLLLVKSAIERVLAALLLVLLSPVFAAVALAVRLSGPGPVIYAQERAGRYGVPFRFHKFRTMQVGAEAKQAAIVDLNESNGHMFKVRDDPRVTPVGRFLRRMSLDELPQLWDVLVGRMALVGPRPLPVPSEAFEGDERRRLRVRPGITGLWQVSGRSDIPWEQAVALDMYYVDHWSLGLDLGILVRTPFTVLRGRGAY